MRPRPQARVVRRLGLDVKETGPLLVRPLQKKPFVIPLEPLPHKGVIMVHLPYTW